MRTFSPKVIRLEVQVDDNRLNTYQKIRALCEELFGKEYVFFKEIPAVFDEELFRRISHDPCMSHIVDAARSELLKHVEQRRAGGEPVWASRKLPDKKEEWISNDLVSVYYLTRLS